MSARSKRESEKTVGERLLKWTVFACGSLLLVAIVGFLIYEALSNAPQPAQLRVEAGEAQEIRGRWRLPVTVRNDGGRPAAAVEVRAKTGPGTSEEEESHATFEYVPQDSERSGVLYFRSRPEGVKVDISGAECP